MVETLVAIVLLTVTVSIIAAMSVRIHHIWKEISHRRVAVAELNNQLEPLTRLPLAELDQAIKNLQVSDACLSILSEVTLEGETIEDPLGARVTLRINWQRKVPGKPLQLSGWVSDLREAHQETRTDD